MSGSDLPLRVCLVTGGGDAPGLNAAVRAFVHSATRQSVLVYGSRYGFEGVLGSEEIVPLRIEDVRGILPRGGSILGCSSRSNPFERVVDEDSARDVTAKLRARLEPLGIDALVLIGGDGTMDIAAKLGARGLRCVGVPKTIDGDLGGTQQTIGLDSAVQAAMTAIDCLHATAEAHKRVLVLEVMGRYAGWIALQAGIAGGADAVLVPEVPYDPARVAAKIRERDALGLRFSIVVVGEGARPIGGRTSELEPGRAGHPARLGGAGDRLAEQLAACDVKHEVRVTVLGHVQRGATPSSFDRLLATRLAAHAADLCAQRRFGRMTCLRNGRVGSVAIDDACTAFARLTPDDELLRCARSLGIETGAE